MRERVRYASLVGLFASVTVCTAASQDRCTELAEAQLPDIRITEAVHRAEGEDGEVAAAHCKVDGVIGREIRFEVLLPYQWNGRFAMGGGGGFVGSVQNSARYTANLGYATAGTDTGHEAPGTSGAWALNHPERQVNFGHLAVHRTAEAAKALIGAYYGEPASYSYFLGCSRGGGQALMEAQRYPADFDGIVAGAPAYDWTGFGAEMVQNMQKSFPNPERVDEPILSPEHLQKLEEAVLAQCDAIDGVEDGVMQDPRQCTFDLSSLPACSSASGEAICYHDEQLAAIEEIYAPPSNAGGSFFVGQPFGAEGHPWGWIGWITGKIENAAAVTGRDVPSLQYAFGIDLAKYFVFGDPDWDYTSYDFSTWEKDSRYAAEVLNATDPDLSAFADSGGKLLLWHGWSDAALSALASIEYYENVESVDPNVRDYFKMYLMPGVLHCGGGPGPDQVDWLSVISGWVERGMAPDRLVASKVEPNGDTVLTRPLCPYPQQAAYDGSGPTDEESSFACLMP